MQNCWTTHCVRCHCSYLVGFVSPQARVLPMSSCGWNPEIFRLSTTRNPDQADQPYCIHHIPGINGIKRTRKPHWPSPLAYGIYLPSPAYYYNPTSVKDLKRIYAKLRPAQDNNQERATQLKRTRAVAPLTGELWQVWYSDTFSDLWSHHHILWRIQKDLPPQFLSLTCRDCRKTSFQIIVEFDHIEARMRYCILHRMCQSIDLIPKISGQYVSTIIRCISMFVCL
jgi:hypothetical protein